MTQAIEIFDRQATIETICNNLAEGKSLRSICQEIGMAESTARYWLSTDAEAFAHSARAKELGCDALADECLEIADDPDMKADDKRIRIDTRVRLIGKWSQRYSDKVLVRNETTVTHRYDLDSLDNDELAALEAIARKAAIASGDTSGDVAPELTQVHRAH